MATIPGGLCPLPRFVFVDGTGTPYAEASLEFFAAGTSTHQDTYNNSDLAVGHENTNPVVADSDGLFGPIYLQPMGYKVILSDSDGNVIWTQDNVEDVGQVFLATMGQTFGTGATGVDSGYTVLDTDQAVTITNDSATSPCVINLPSATTRGLQVLLLNQCTQTVSVTPNGSDTINGVAGAFTMAASATPVFPWLLLYPTGTSNWLGLYSTAA